MKNFNYIYQFVSAVWNLNIQTSYFSHVWIFRTNSSQRVKNSCEFVTEYERICHTCVTHTFHTSFIGSMNANSSHCSKYPKKLPFCYIRFFHICFIIFLITLWIENFSMLYYAYSRLLEFPGQVLELNRFVWLSHSNEFVTRVKNSHVIVTHQKNSNEFFTGVTRLKLDICEKIVPVKISKLVVRIFHTYQNVTYSCE